MTMFEKIAPHVDNGGGGGGTDGVELTNHGNLEYQFRISPHRRNVI